MVTRLVLENFKLFRAFALPLNSDLNNLVGNNEAGKSTVQEAIILALTRKLNGRPVDYELSSHLFNQQAAAEYLAAVKEKKAPVPPRIRVEVHLKETVETAFLRGTNNLEKADVPGVSLEIAFDPTYKSEYEKWLTDPSEKRAIPAEYYAVTWMAFSGNAITSRSLPISVFAIDASTIRLQSGTDYFVQSLIGDTLPTKDRVALAVAYRKLKEQFADEASIKTLNDNLTKAGLTGKKLTVTLDTSQKTNWETNLIPHLDDLPFQFSGKGEQTRLKILLALERKADACDVITHASVPSSLRSYTASVLDCWHRLAPGQNSENRIKSEQPQSFCGRSLSCEALKNTINPGDHDTNSVMLM